MELKKTIALTLSAVMSAAALPILTAGAADAYVRGDVDMDGVITGHDTAMVSRYIYDDSFTLTGDALALADVNQDGVVNQIDNEWIHANEVAMIGDGNENGFVGVDSAYHALQIANRAAHGEKIEISDSVPRGTENLDAGYDKINTITYHLLDADADGTVTFQDAYAILVANAYYTTGSDFYFAEGRYDLFGKSCVVVPVVGSDGLISYTIDAAVGSEYGCGDVDQDGIITGHDTAMISRYLYVDSSSLTAEQCALADTDKDGDVDADDMEHIHGNEDYNIGVILSRKSESKPNMQSAATAMQIASSDAAGNPITIIENSIIQDGKNQISRIGYNLLDANADGKVDMQDAYNLLLADSRISSGYSSFYAAEGRYDLFDGGNQAK